MVVATVAPHPGDTAAADTTAVTGASADDDNDGIFLL